MSERWTLASAETSALDRLADAAAKQPVPRGPDGDAVLREALWVGRARARAAARRRAFVRAGAIAVVVLAVAGAWVARSTPEAPIVATPPVGRLELAALGHRVEALDGARLDATELDRERARFRLEAGAALFDVAPRTRWFEVRTPDATITVHGTVFAVNVEDEGTHVEVFEGRVEVRDARGVRRLEQGESYATRAGLRTPALLTARGERAVARRAAETPATIDAPLAREASTNAEPPPTAAPSHEPPPTRRAPSPRVIDLAAVRELCARGEWTRALEAIADARPPRSELGEWALLEGDAQRALGHVEAAARAYERAAESLSPSRAALAGFLAATQHERAGQPADALGVLDRTHAAERGSPVEERALAMRARLLARVGRTHEARTAARAYLASFPSGAAIAEMERVALTP
jgi:hypothetical protein